MCECECECVCVTMLWSLGGVARDDGRDGMDDCEGKGVVIRGCDGGFCVLGRRERREREKEREEGRER